MGADSLSLLDLLIEHELAIGRLYGVFADRFTDHNHFWHNLATEEQSHADRLSQLHTSSTLMAWLRTESRLKPAAINESIKYVDGQATSAKNQSLPHLRALAIARDLESALLEKVFARVGSAVPLDIRSVLMELAADTERHRKAIVAMLEDEKKRQPQTGKVAVY